MRTWRLLDTGALPGLLNMAVDQALLTLKVRGEAPPTLRFYQWQPPAVSLGYFQKNPGLDLAACRHLGLEVVRRPTGGRAVLHLGDLTYAVVAGTEDGIPAAVTAAYRLICEGLLRGFSLLGIEAGMGRSAGRQPAQREICFLGGAAGSIEFQGRKFVGSAQTWRASSLLQHGSIMLTPQTAALASLWPDGAGSPAARRAGLEARITSLEDILGRPPQAEAVQTALIAGMAQAWGVEFVPAELTAAEWALAREIAGKDFWERGPGAGSTGFQPVGTPCPLSQTVSPNPLQGVGRGV